MTIVHALTQLGTENINTKDLCNITCHCIHEKNR